MMLTHCSHIKMYLWRDVWGSFILRSTEIFECHFGRLKADESDAIMSGTSNSNHTSYMKYELSVIVKIHTLVSYFSRCCPTFQELLNFASLVGNQWQSVFFIFYCSAFLSCNIMIGLTHVLIGIANAREIIFVYHPHHTSLPGSKTL
jgi:hypothetical protein